MPTAANRLRATRVQQAILAVTATFDPSVIQEALNSVNAGSVRGIALQTARRLALQAAVDLLAVTPIDTGNLARSVYGGINIGGRGGYTTFRTVDLGVRLTLGASADYAQYVNRGNYAAQIERIASSYQFTIQNAYRSAYRQAALSRLQDLLNQLLGRRVSLISRFARFINAA